MSAVGDSRRERPAAAAAAAVVVALALAATVGTLLLTGGAPRPAPAGLPDAGRLTGWAAPTLRLLLDLTAIATVGCALVACLGEPGRVRALRAARVAAVAWLLAAVGFALVTVSDLSGAPLAEVRPIAGARLLLQVPQGRALVAMVLAALLVIRGARHLASARGAAVLLAASVLALACLAQTGHASTTSHHYLATQALVVHVVGASLWIGGLGALLVLLRGRALADALEPFSRIALGCFAAVAVSGLASAWLRIGWDPASWRSAYGAGLAAKVVVVVGLGVLGAWHRRRTLPALRTGDRKPFVRIAGLELLWMAVAVGIGVGLARSPLPPAAATRVRPVHAAAVATVDPQLPALSWTSLLLQTRPDALVITVLAVALVALVVWRRRIVRRIAPLVLGLLLLGWCLVGGLAAYSAAVPQGQVAQVLVLALVVAPLLLVGTRLSPGRSATRGVVGLLVVLGILSSGMLDVTLGNPALHLALAVGALTAGFALFGSVFTDDPARRGDSATTLTVLAVVLGCHGALVVGGGLPLAGDWFARLGQAGADPERDQTIAGVLLLLGAVGVAAVGLLRRERPGVGDADGHPALELDVGAEAVGDDPHPAVHLAAAHHERVGVRMSEERRGLVGVDPEE